MAAFDTFELALRMTPSHRNLAELCEPLSFRDLPRKRRHFSRRLRASVASLTLFQGRLHGALMSATQSLFGPSASKLRSTQAGRSHEPGDALATNVNAHVFKFGMNHRGAIGTVRVLMNQSDFVGELGVRSGAFRWWTRSPCVVARLRDTERFAHDRSCMHCLVCSYESERRLGIAALS